MKDRLSELIRTSDILCDSCGENAPSYCAEAIADYLIKNGVSIFPCKVGDTVYKICPKCNPNHNGSCNHCAWSGCHLTGCDVGVGVWSDGSYNEKEKQLVPYKVTENRFITIIKYWNIMFFATVEEAEKAKNEYVEICNIEDRKERYKKYLLWEAEREVHYPFLESGDTE